MLLRFLPLFRIKGSHDYPFNLAIIAYLIISIRKLRYPFHTFNFPDVVILQRNQNVNAFISEMKNASKSLMTEGSFKSNGFRIEMVANWYSLFYMVAIAGFAKLLKKQWKVSDGNAYSKNR